MTNAIQRDQKRRKLFKKYELKRLEYKSIIRDCKLPKEVRYLFLQKLNKLPRNSSKTRIRNRCVISGRSRGVLQFCKLSRIVFRDFAGSGLLPGISKKSW